MSSEQHSSHSVYIYTLGPSRQKILIYPSFTKEIGQTLSQQVKLSVSHSMLSKLTESSLAFSLKCQDQDCMSR